MNNVLQRIIAEYESEIGKLEGIRSTGDGYETYPQLSVTLLGQFSLIVQTEFASKVTLVATQDLDAWLKGNSVPRDIFKVAVLRHGLRYDEQSDLIWMPPNQSERRLLYESETIKVEAFDPLLVIVSKAIKAPEKNRQLVLEAIGIFKEELIEEIVRYGGDPEAFFRKE